MKSGLMRVMMSILLLMTMIPIFLDFHGWISDHCACWFGSYFILDIEDSLFWITKHLIAT